MLEAPTVQDGGATGTSRYTRLLAFNVSSPLIARPPPLIGEWVVPLPQSDTGITRSANDVHFVSDNVFLVLARDSNGHGGENNTSTYK